MKGRDEAKDVESSARPCDQVRSEEITCKGATVSVISSPINQPLTTANASDTSSALCVEKYFHGITSWSGFAQQLDFIDILTEMV